MEFTIRGHLLLEKNPIFADPAQSLGANDIKYLIITCFEESELTRFGNFIRAANVGKPLEDRMSFPIQFERDPKSLHVMCKFRNPQPDTLLKRIDFMSTLRSVPLVDWIGNEFLIKVRSFKYDFTNTTCDKDVIDGGSSIRRKGYVYHILNIKLA
jgi:hypothetical protein